MVMPVSVSDDLVLRVDVTVLALSPRQGLALAEILARKSFRRLLDEEVDRAQRQTNRRPAIKRRSRP